MSGIGSRPDDEQERVVPFVDGETGLRGITVLDSTGIGPCVGACRSRPYTDECRAAADAVRQARTVRTKALIADLPVGGACTVLLDRPLESSRQESPMPALGRAVEAQGGCYWLMPDLQGDLNDMDQAGAATAHVLGRKGEMEIGVVEATALGLLFGIEAAVRQKLGKSDLTGVRIGIIGLGSVGFRLTELLRLEGARMTIADRDPRRTEHAVRALGINCVATEEIIHLDLDVLVPVAAKDMIDEGILTHLRCKVLAGAVDDPLKSPALVQKLHDRNILYAPDTVINAGGLISLVQPLLSQEQASVPVLQQLQAIRDRMSDIAERSIRDNLPTAVVAANLAENALAERQGAKPAELLAS